MRLPLGLVVGGLLALFSLLAAAQAYPSRPVRLIVPYPPGQGTDILGRLVAGKLSAALGQGVVVDNRAGAGGIIGTDAAAKSAPDGYTLFMATSGPLAIVPFLRPEVPYDPIRDFAPISNIGLTAHVLVVAPDFPARSVQELVALARAKVGLLNYASPGAGTTQHLSMEMFRSRLGLAMVHIPYKGSSDAQLAVIGGAVAMMFDSIPTLIGPVQTGRLRALAVSTAERSPFMPEVPTVAETVSPGFDSAGWIGIAAPAGTPPQIIARLHAEIVKIIDSADMREHLKALAFLPIGDTPEHFKTVIAAEVAKFGKVVKDSGIKLE
jgi:tripartite-type tricarboxylate transporter receptor subunit TctC